MRGSSEVASFHVVDQLLVFFARVFFTAVCHFSRITRISLLPLVVEFDSLRFQLFVQGYRLKLVVLPTDFVHSPDISNPQPFSLVF